MDTIKLAFDAMGGDFGPEVTVPAMLDRLSYYPELQVIMVGDKHAIEKQLKRHPHQADKFKDRWTILHAPQVVTMDEQPAAALRKKRSSSMRLAIDLVKEGAAHACVSAGNTGALMAIARFVLKTLPGIDRPAIASSLPTRTGECIMLDLGANLDCQAEHLLQFAVMGSVLAEAVYGKIKPTVALLNVGVEQIKGNEPVKKAAEYLKNLSGINYTGFVEGDGIYLGHADVVVCDGFVGNAALKTSEGVAKFIVYLIKKQIQKNWINQLTAFMAQPMLRALAHDMDPKRYNGASLLGLRGIVVKSHGGADELALRYAIDESIREIKHNVPQQIEKQVAALIQKVLIEND